MLISQMQINDATIERRRTKINGVRYNFFTDTHRVSVNNFEKKFFFKEPIDAAFCRRALELKLGIAVPYEGSAQQYIDKNEAGLVPQQFFI